MRLGSLTRPELIFPDLPATDRSGVLRAFAERVAAQGLVRDAGELNPKLREREQHGTTRGGSGKGLRQGVVAIGMVAAGVDFEAADRQPVKVFFLVISPSESPAEHLQVLAAISRWVKADRHAERILALSDPQEIYDFLRREEG